MGFGQLAFLLFFLLFPQQPSNLEKDKLCTIEGVVLKASNGEPLHRTEVTLRRIDERQPGIQVRTNREGRFVFEDVAPGRYRLRLSRPGYISQNYGERRTGSAGAIMALVPGQRVRELTFRMVRSGVIAGKIFHSDGEPMQEVEVSLMQFQRESGRRQLSPVRSDMTNDLGEYRLFGLTPGRYYLMAQIRRFTFSDGRKVTSEEQENYARSFYPGTTDPGRAAAIEIRGGEEVLGMDWTPVLQQAYRVRGRVFNAVLGAPARRVSIQVIPYQKGQQYFTWGGPGSLTDANGNFELSGIPSGSYVAMAHFFHDGTLYRGSQAFEISGADVGGITVVIQRGVDIPGVVHLPQGLDLKAGEMRVFLEGEEILEQGTFATVDADGRFLLKNVAIGNYKVRAYAEGADHYLKEIRIGTEDILGKDLEIGPEGPAGGLEITLGAPGGRIEGLILNDESLPLSGAHAVLVPEEKLRGAGQLYRWSTSDQFGRFEMKGIRPGTYKLFAWEYVESEDWLDPEFLAPFEDAAVKIQVTENTLQTVQLKVLVER